MKKQILSEEFRRMQKLAGLLNEDLFQLSSQGDKNLYTVYVYDEERGRGRSSYKLMGKEDGDIKSIVKKTLSSFIENSREDFELNAPEGDEYEKEKRDMESYLEEFLIVLKLDESLYIIGTGQETSIVIGTKQSPIFRQFLELVETKGDQAAGDYLVDMVYENEEDVTSQFI